MLGKVERSFTFGIETHTIDNDQVSSMAEGTSNAGAGEIRCGIEATVARQTMPCSCDCIFKETVIGSKVEILPLKFKVLILVSLAIKQKSVEFGLVLDKPRWFYHR